MQPNQTFNLNFRHLLNSKTSLQKQILITVSSLLLIALLPTIALLTWTARRSLLERTQAEGVRIAQVLALSAGVVEKIPQDVEKVLEDQMIVSATITAHLVGIAEASGLSPEQINNRLKAIVKASVLDEFWITDEKGKAYLTNTGVDFTFSPDPQKQPQAHIFWQILQGSKKTVVQEARRREVDNQIFKYVAVAGLDKPRIVQVGYNAQLLESIRQKVGIKPLVNHLLKGENVRAIWVVDSKLKVLAADRIAKSTDSDAALDLGVTDLSSLQNAIASNQIFSQIDGKFLKVVAPLPDTEGHVRGAAMVYLSLESVQDALNDQLKLALALTIVVLTIGLSASYFLSRWITQPILLLSRASKLLSEGQWEQVVAINRSDELGELGNSFNLMANQLQDSFRALEKVNADLEDRVEERTEALRISEERFQLTMQSVNDGIWDWYLDTNQVYFSPQWKLILGYADDELVNKLSTWEELTHPEDLGSAYAGIHAHLKGLTSTYHLEFRMRHKDGDYRWILSRAKVVAWDGMGQPLRLVGSHTDISDRKVTEIELQAAKQAADNANQAKSEFLANMSHELRTPLNGILGYAQILGRMDALPEKVNQGVHIIHQCGSHLLTLINDVLDIAKIEARKLELDPKAIYLPALIQGVVEISQIRADQKRLDFIYEADRHLPMGIITDEKRLRQVLINLVGNAIKFTDKGSVILKVEPLEINENNTHLRFAVTDTGVGIAPDDLQKLFRAFEQVGDRSRQAEGTGLGLAISQQIVQLMGGQIQVESQLGIGSTFFFEIVLPLANDWNQQQNISAGNIVSYQGERKKILVVDDRWENRGVILSLLEPLGFMITEAENGLDGLEKIRMDLPDLVILDLSMPVMNGFELLKHLRNDQSLRHLKVIVSSASVSNIDRQLSLEAGGDDFLAKPVHAEDLFNALATHLQLTWNYEETATEVNDAEREIIAPDPADLQILLELVRDGLIKKVTQVAKEIEQKDARYQPFIQKILQLAKKFQSEQIEELIQKHLHDK
ncbi:ATP-binding protein [Pseudanabaena sp. UWO310]|uniref:ATP-binding protein n=1 Tax=Pseudanabaena sp. UWO310 TaxID=2480795 RepID=UPI0011587C24|nr:ATP-binding protein [Pseudanabaena sp. UWO310]TYQ30437.1 PAS domain-containing protein [Pseudanabaena sp. UWO310]